MRWLEEPHVCIMEAWLVFTEFESTLELGSKWWKERGDTLGNVGDWDRDWISEMSHGGASL